MRKSLRKLARYAQRASRILLNQGPRVLVQAIQRSLESPQPPLGLGLELMDLVEPFEPLRFPECSLPTASVVIPLRDDFRLAHHCLAALLTHQGAHPFEVIVVVDSPGAAGFEDQHLWENVRFVANVGSSGFGAACDSGAAVACGQYVVFLNDRTQVQPGWLDALIDTFSLRGDTAVVGSRLFFPDGRLKEAGGIVLRDGALRGYGFQDEPYRPEYSYLRAVDYCSGTCLAVRRSLYLELTGFDGKFAASSYMHVDFAFRARQAGFSVCYQPLSEVVCYDNQRPDNDIGLGAAHRELFERRWRIALQEHGSPGDPLELEKERSVTGRAFCSDFALPAPARDSGSLRIVNLFVILQERGYKVTFASMGLEARQPYLSDLQKRGIQCLYRPYVDSIDEHLRQGGAEYDLVILSRAETAAELMQPARRWCRNAKIIFDTVDLHFQRIARQAAIRKDRRIARIAMRVRRQELRLIAEADTTLVVSEAEKALLSLEAPAADVRVISNIHQIFGSARPFEERGNILFIGGFGHPPNTDAVLFFCEEILPMVLTALPEVQFLVIGSDPPPEVANLASDSVRILGFVPDVEPYLKGSRLSVAPLRFGAGVKGKINQSLAHGLPVVASPVAAEGMFLSDGESVLIAEDPRQFADAVLRLYQDKILWNRLSKAGLAVMDEHFSFAAARRAVADLLEP